MQEIKGARNRVWAVGIILASAVFLVLGYLRVSRADEQVSSVASAPGFEDAERTLDTSTFSLPTPEGGGPTTIPGDPLPYGSETTSSSTSSTTTSTLPPPPTTTSQPQASAPEIASQIENICGLSESMQSLIALTRSEQFDERGVADQMTRNLERYEAVAPDEVRPAVSGLRLDFARVVVILEENDWQGDSPPMLAAVDDILSRRAPFENLLSNLDTVILAEQKECAG